jgi:hypothetical protein
MEYDLCWDNEIVADDDESIKKIEADALERKAFLTSLSKDEELLFIQ